jgi:nicotinamide riboside kinase
VLRIAILGAESTGKTSLARAMAQQLRGQGARVQVIEEVLREWCNANGRTPRSDEQAAIVQTQIALVDAASPCDYLLCDNTPLMTAIYSDLLFSDATLYPVAVQQQRRYALNLLAEPDLPWQADGIQRDGPAARDQVDRRLREVLQIYALPVYPVCGLGAARLASATAALAQFHASGNHADSSPADAHAGAPS